MNQKTPIEILGLTRAEAAMLSHISKGERQIALGALRKYFALLFHPDHNPAGHEAMASINAAIDTLLQKERIEDYLTGSNIEVSGSQEKWLQIQLKEERNLTQQLRQQLAQKEAEYNALLPRLRSSKRPGEAINKEMELELKKRYHIIDASKARLLRATAAIYPLPLTEFELSKSHKEKPVVVLAPSGVWYKSIVKGNGEKSWPAWHWAGRLVGFLPIESIRTIRIGMAAPPLVSPITRKSPKFDRIWDGLQPIPQRKCCLVVSDGWLLKCYGRVLDWRSLKTSID